MASSPEHRLPPASSLPDGFVDSPEEPLKEALSPATTDDDDVPFDLDLALELAVRSSLSESAGVGTLSPGDAARRLGRLDALTDFLAHERILSGGNASPEGSSIGIRGQDTKVQLELSTSNLKESTEAKQKSVKCSKKTAKELLELTVKYQKVRAERDAAISTCEMYKSLQRELQQQNQMLVDECQRLTTEEQNMVLNLSIKLSDSIRDISKRLDEQKRGCLSQLGKNERLREELRDLANRHYYLLREQQFALKLEEKVLKLQLAGVAFKQQEEKSAWEQNQSNAEEVSQLMVTEKSLLSLQQEVASNKEIFQQLQQDLKFAREQNQKQIYAEQVSQLIVTEKSLQQEVASNEEKFQQLQEPSMKSSQSPLAFKLEMDKMTKLIEELEKENEFFKSKCDSADVFRLAEEFDLTRKQLEKAENQKETIESLCRVLHAERKCIMDVSTTNQAAAAASAEQVRKR